MPEIGAGSDIRKRPLIITILCVLNFIGLTITFLGLLIPENRAVIVQRAGEVMVPMAFVITISAFVGMVGYWKMRKWGVWIYSGMAIIDFGSDFLLNLSLSQIGIIQMMLKILVIAVGIAYFNRMTYGR
jgi:hypothetical protein